MGTLKIRTTAFDAKVDTRPGEPVLEALRRSNLPLAGFLLSDDSGRFVSLAHAIGADDTVTAMSIRNPDFTILNPAVTVHPAGTPVAEIFVPGAQGPELLQFDRQAGIDYIYASFAAVLDKYRAANPGERVVQIALSGGGDGRIVGECAGRYQDEHPDVRFFAVITANGFEDEGGHIKAAVGIAQRFGLTYEVFDESRSAVELGYKTAFEEVLQKYHAMYPADEREVIATLWVQQLNLEIAENAGRRAVIFGFNQEDVIAERLYQMLIGRPLPAYPIRDAKGFHILAPLHRIPKQLIDALDLDNSRDNYARRQPSVSARRSQLYFLAYFIIANFPDLAAGLADPSIVDLGDDPAPQWLLNPRAEQ
ncbi:hypothetical protein [Phytohabitans aurantiacus]|uniref:Asparagine synthetase domain-containing protein n=1 Tax=Phytohabitans aurantiacus TaxID=3016789 RepID=A0ABQ5QZA6_9ACTN|nr:hypothetical protein [Phytohabitans aurantiacus]GLH99893.1 hypothetical protein Pa4123_51690 [Phytohabitans aurantiacus]